MFYFRSWSCYNLGSMDICWRRPTDLIRSEGSHTKNQNFGQCSPLPTPLGSIEILYFCSELKRCVREKEYKNHGNSKIKKISCKGWFTHLTFITCQLNLYSYFAYDTYCCIGQEILFWAERRCSGDGNFNLGPRHMLNDNFTVRDRF